MIKSKIHNILGILSSTFILSVNAVEIDKELQDLLKLDLEELTTVSIASKKQESVNDAPGIITVVSAKQIKRYGYRNLRDVLDRQTNMMVTGSNTFPHNRTVLRGSAFTHTDNSVLLLLNGRPLRDASSTSLNHDFYQSFPVESIKQLEIIRGPGSVLYGTNAFTGAINIITKDAPSSNEGTMAITYGSFDTKKIAATGGGTWGDLEVFASVNAFDIGGDDFNNINGESGSTGTYETGSNGGHFVLNAKYKGFTLNSFLSDVRRDHARSSFTLPSSDLDLERQYFDIGYEHDISDKWSASINYSLNHFRDEFQLGSSATTQLGDADDHFVEITTHYDVNKKLELIAGGSYNFVDGRAKLGGLDWNTQNYSFYGQADYWALDWLKVIGGLQYNKPDSIDGDISLRFATIANITDHWGVKLLYGQAFRNASPIERFLVAPTILGNADLTPEKMETYDAQIFYNKNNTSLSVTYYHSIQADLITRTGTSPQVFSNAGIVKFDGIELEGKYDFWHGFDFIGNLSYQTNDKNDGTNDVTYAPDWMIKTGLNYTNNNGLNVGIFNSFFAKSTLQNHQDNAVSITNPDNESYNNLTANLKLNLGEFINNKSFSNTTLSLFGDNLLDEDIFFPSVNRKTVNSVPHHMGRGFYGTISIDF
jgi:outer membrane receptor protein involved in Fe transport